MLSGINEKCGVTQLLVPRVKPSIKFAELMSDLDKEFFATYFYWKCHFSICPCLYWLSFEEVLLQVCKLKSSLKLFFCIFKSLLILAQSLCFIFTCSGVREGVCCWRIPLCAFPDVGGAELKLYSYFETVHFLFKTACGCYPMAFNTRCFKASSVYWAEIR